MAETFEKILVKDDRLGCITSKVKYQVFKGGQNITCQPFKAISETAASHVYNVTVPSLETVISREVLWQSTVTLRIDVAGKDAAEFAVNYGVTDALAPFPLHSLVATMTATINNNTISQNMQDTLPVLLRMVDPEEFAKYDSMTPTALDYLAYYEDGVDQLPFQVGAGVATDSTTRTYFPGAAEGGTAAGNNLTRPYSYYSYPNNILALDMNRPAGTAYYHRPRGSWKIRKIYAINAADNAQRLPLITDTTVYVQFQVTEPLLLSPFVFGSGYGKQGFYGIQSMNFQFNMTPTANRAWRCAQFRPATLKTVSVSRFEDSQLLFQFLTPHASDMLDPRNVVPFYELPIYRTSNFPILPAAIKVPSLIGEFASPASVTLNSSNIQLSGIPDKLIIFVRKLPSQLRPHETDSYATIRNISLNFNNQAGLLSSMTPEQLFRNSVQSGLANMSWEEFSGSVLSVCGNYNPAAPIGGSTVSLRDGYAGVGPQAGSGAAPQAHPGITQSATTGTILVLNFAEVIQLTEEYYAPGSLGTFNLQLTLQVQNNQYADWAAGSYELVIMPMNSGVFVNERGTSSTFLSLLTKQDVLDSLQQQPYANYEVRRMVGGGFLDSMRSALGWVKSKLPAVRGVLEQVQNPYAQAGATVLKTLGYGKGHQAIDNRLA